MTRVPVNGVELNVEVSGHGPPLIALHGFTGSSETWLPLAGAIDSSFTVVSVDLLGHGGSSRPDDPSRYSMRHKVDDLLSLQKALGADEANWLGYSMGGRIALSLAVAAPEQCKSLLLESASPGILDAGERAERVASDEELAICIEEQGVNAFVDYWEKLPLFATQVRLPQEVQEGLRAQRLRNDSGGLASSLRGVGAGAQPPLGSSLPGLIVPVCFIVGEEDARYCLVAQEMAAAVPNGRVVTIPSAGHSAHLEQPERFHQVVAGFLRESYPVQVGRS